MAGIFRPGAGRLIGRSGDRARLVRLLRQLSDGRSRSVFVSGDSGVGKSALVASAVSAVEHEALVLVGKADQLAAGRPFSGFATALDPHLGELAASGSPVAIDFGRRLSVRLGHRSGLLCTAIPSLADLVGPQPNFDAVALDSMHHLLDEAFLMLFNEISATHGPVVLLLDDLQWSDDASLRVLKALLANPELESMAILAVHRSADPSAHPGLDRLVGEIASGEIPDVVQLDLRPLDRDQTAHLIGDLLDSDPKTTVDLAELVWTKTEGNPFFVGEFVNRLLEDGLVSTSDGQIAYDLARITASPATSNVAAMTRSRILRLPLETQRMLGVAGLVGPKFSLSMVARLTDQKVETTVSALAPALAAGLIRSVGATLGHVGGLQFGHDRVQEAATDDLDDEARRRLHTSIANTLIDDPERSRGPFEVAEHFAAGLGPRADGGPDAARYLTTLHSAAQGSRHTGAFPAGLRYSSTAREAAEQLDSSLPGAPSWFELSLELAEQQLCNGEHAAALTTLEDLETQDLDLVQGGQIALARMVALSAQGLFIEAFTAGQSALATLGYALPEAPSKEDEREILELLLAEIGDRSPSELATLGENHDQISLIAAQLLMRLGPPSFAGLPHLFPFVTIRGVLIALRHGNSPWAASSYAMLGIWLGHERGIDRDLAFGFGELGYELSQRYGDPSAHAMCAAIHGGLVAHWKLPLADCVEIALRSYDVGMAGGEVLWSAYGLQLTTYLLGGSGISLDELFTVLDDYRLKAAALANPGAETIIAAQQLGLAVLRGPDLFSDDFKYAGLDIAALRELPSPGYLYAAHCQQALVHLLRGEYDQCLGLMPEIETGADFCKGTCWLAEVAFIEASALLHVSDGRPERVDSQLGYLRFLAEANPVVYGPHRELLEAEVKIFDQQADPDDLADHVAHLIAPAVAAARRAENLKFEALAHRTAFNTIERIDPANPRLQEFRDAAMAAFERWKAPSVVAAIAGPDQSLVSPSGRIVRAAKGVGDTSGEVAQSVVDRGIAEGRPLLEVAGPSEHALARAFDEIDTGSVVVGPDLIVTFANEAARRFATQTQGDLVGQPLDNMFELYEPAAPSRLPASQIAGRQFVDARSPDHRLELRHPELGRQVECWAVPIAGASGEPDTTVIFIRDVTPSDRLERDLLTHSTTLSLGRLVGGIAHDFNNMLMTISACTEVLQGQWPRPAEHVEQVLDALKGTTSQATTLTSQLLTVGQSGSETHLGQDAGHEVDGVVRELALLLGLSAGDTEITTVLGAEGVVSAGSRVAVHNALLNLCINAIEAMPDGGLLRVETAIIDVDTVLANAWDVAAGKYVRIEVSDTGSGMDAAVLPHIFEPYFTASTRRSGPGLGLGLATVQATILGLGGFVDVFSQPGLGATFQAFLPVLARDAATPDSSSSQAEVSSRNTNAVEHRTILMIDDDRSVVTMLCHALELRGYTCFGAVTLEDARTEFARSYDQIDVVLLDMLMPDGDTRELIPFMTGIDPTVRILLCSGIDAPENFHDDEVAVRGRLTKPFHSDVLVAAVDTAIANHPS